jgi:hypothetical protein
MLLSSPANESLSGTSTGTAEADASIAAAKALGAPSGVAIFRDVEQGYAIDSAYISAWAAAFVGSGYVPGFYENPINGEFASQYCDAVGGNSKLGSSVMLYSSEPDYASGDPTRASMPSWAPNTPGCANTTVAWQYDIHTYFPGYANVDTDEFVSDYSGLLWGATPPLTENLLENASFASSSAGWFANAEAGSVSYAQYPSSHYYPGFAHDGGGFLEMNTSEAGASIAQNVAITTQPGQSYSLSVWLRSAPGQGPVSGVLALWGLGGTQESTPTNFIVGPEWTLVTVPLDVQNSGHTELRAEIYMDTAHANFDVDGASFESGEQVGTGPPAITTRSLPDGKEGSAYDAILRENGGTLPLTWSRVSGAKPPGLSFSKGGIWSGRPTKAGTYSFAVRVTDADGATRTETLKITVVH